MTTVAWDSVSLCSDSLMTCDGRRVGTMKKIYRTNFGLVAVSGQVSAVLRVVQWVADGEARLKPEEDLDFTALWIKHDGTAWGIESDFNPYPMSGPCTLGSGGDIALAALTLGKTAREAVELGIKLDCISGGDIQELIL
jgi:hypothetical protein